MIPRLYDQYNDSVRIIWRSGTADDPYREMLEHQKIINNKITLSEIPVEFHRVVINGFFELDQRKPSAKKIPEENDFIVNYSNGIITFHPSQEGKTVVAKYRGRGFIQYPASRIWAHYPNPDVVMNLQDIIEISHKRISDVEIAIENAILATNNANIAAEGASIAAFKANQAADSAASASNTAIDASKRADESAKTALDAVLTTRLVWLEPVATYSDIVTTYPNPVIGSTTMVLETGARYRYEGDGVWREIDNYTRGSIPLASPTVHGLMSSDDYKLTHEKLKQRQISFILPVITDIGVQKVFIPFDFSGKVKSIVGLCGRAVSSGRTILYIEKISQEGFGGTTETWERITPSEIIFDINETHAFVPPIENITVNKGDVFRIYVEEFDPSQEGISINITIEL